jgi:DNA mismatch endonuclease (patch repair protein)
MDKISKEKRSEIMSKIHSKNTRLEVNFRKRLWALGLRYRLHYKIPGKPDVVIVSRKTAIFIDGCFWHKCKKCYRKPHSNKRYWEKKIQHNLERDKETNNILRSQGWIVIRIWEHEINKNLEAAAQKIIKQIEG